MPFRLRVGCAHCGPGTFRLLDVGCGNHSPTITKKWFPACEYHGLDYRTCGNDEDDARATHRHYNIDLSRQPLDPVPDAFFEVVLMAHSVEHLRNGLDVVRALATKLKAGGRIYVEFPSERSLSLPSMRGTLQFCDDPTHVRLYSVRELSNVLMESGLRVVRAGRRRDWLRLWLLPILLPAKLVLRGRLEAGDVWDLMGFADYVLAMKPL